MEWDGKEPWKVLMKDTVKESMEESVKKLFIAQ